MKTSPCKNCCKMTAKESLVKWWRGPICIDFCSKQCMESYLKRRKREWKKYVDTLSHEDA